MSEKQWKQFVQLYGEKNQHLNKQQVLQQAKKQFQKLQKLFNQRGGKVKVLDVLDLSGKELDWDAIEYAMDNDIQYENIIFRNCMMTDDDLKQLCVDTGSGAFFIGGESIKKLDLSHNEINGGKEGSIQYLCQLIQDNDMSPDEIDLSHNDIGDDGLTSLLEAIYQKENCRLLKVDNNYFSQNALIIASSYLRTRETWNLFDFHVSCEYYPDELLEAILYNPLLRVTLYSKKETKIIDINSNEVKKAKEEMAKVACS